MEIPSKLVSKTILTQPTGLRIESFTSKLGGSTGASRAKLLEWTNVTPLTTGRGETLDSRRQGQENRGV